MQRHSELPITTRFHVLDLLRGLAIIPVVITHADSRVAPGGNLGVIVFFVISGFLIAQQVSKSGFALNEFLWHRFCRIYLPAWASIVLLAVMIIVLPMAFKPFQNLAELPYAYMLSYLFYFPSSAVLPTFNSYSVQSLWSLHAEIWFYLIAAILAARLGDKLKFALVCLLAFFLISTLGGEFSIYSNFLPFAGCFLVGVCAEQISKQIKIGNQALGPLSLAAFLAIFVYFCINSEPGNVGAMWLVAISAALAILVCKDAPPPRIIVLEFIGTLSFSIYLLQGPFVDFRVWLDVQQLYPHKIDTLFQLSSLASVLMVSSLMFHYWVEKPLSKLGRVRKSQSQ